MGLVFILNNSWFNKFRGRRRHGYLCRNDGDFVSAQFYVVQLVFVDASQ